MLASASPRRSELLASAGFRFVVEPSAVIEVRGRDELAIDFATRLAREKAVDVGVRRRDEWVLGADTIVVVDGDPLGKPVDRTDAERMLGRLSGRSHQVVTAFALVAPGGRIAVERAVVSDVAFRPLAAAEITAYVAGGEPLDKAGAYAIQGGARSFVRELRGSLTNVIGLPLDEVVAALRAQGLEPEGPPP